MLDNIRLMKKQLEYYGGVDQQERMNNDKLRSLKKSLLYSYQAATAILDDGRMFRCLINPDKEKADYDNKEISIPFEDICLNSEHRGKGVETIGMKAGDVFEWKENGSHWLVTLPKLQETAYFRSEIRRCDQQIELNGKSYWVYLRGPNETTIQWRYKGGVNYNDLNYSLVMYITADENSLDFFHRFTKIKIDGNTWQVVNANKYYYDGIIEVFLDEWYNNSLMEGLEEEEPPVVEEEIYINGPETIYSYEEYEFNVPTELAGEWSLSSNIGTKVRIMDESESSIKLYVNTGRRCDFILSFSANNGITLNKTIKIESY